MTQIFDGSPLPFFGALFVLFHRNPLIKRKVENASRLAYRYDRDAGIVQIWQSGGSGGRTLLGRGHIDAEARLRDAGGRIIGRALPDGGVIIDPDTLPGYRAQSGAAGAGAHAQERTDAAGEPKLCPDCPTAR